jgi:hypothetical protein
MPRMADLDLGGMKELVRNAWVDVSDADRCVSMDISPSPGRLHRRLRDSANAMNVLIIEIERLRMSALPKEGE